MSAASLDTSVPAMPMATPMSAFFNAGESLTPSPVTATMLPALCRALVALHNEQLLLGTRPGEGDLIVGSDQLVEHVVA